MASVMIDRKAVNLVRYSVPAGGRISVAEGLCMVVTRVFHVRGILVLGGVIRLGGGL